MSAFRLPFPTESLSQAFSQIPEDVRAIFRQGFSVIANLRDDKRDLLIAYAVDALDQGITSATDELRSRMELSGPEVDAALGSMLLLTSSVSHPAGRIGDDVKTGLLKAQLVDVEDQPKLETTISVLKSRGAELASRMARSGLADRVFPAYRGIQTAVDLRVQGGKVRLAVPVAMIRIGTDEEKEFQFQINLGNLRRLIKRLQDLQRRMEEVEKFAATWEKARG